ncbi:MAG: threonine ammonia-lyase, biosynthetic, partial [Microthrixaceae bacterium]|nr:threonine ammonia-lyase, biosynthetic [Microthrixaceae bacterium]
MTTPTPEPAPTSDYLQRILTARVYDLAVESPLEFAPSLSERIGADVWLKREDTQSVHSFKVRGA